MGDWSGRMPGFAPTPPQFPSLPRTWENSARERNSALSAQRVQQRLVSNAGPPPGLDGITRRCLQARRGGKATKKRPFLGVFDALV